MRLFILCTLVFLLNGCASMQSTTQQQGQPGTQAEQPLTEVYAKYQGTPYQYGGMDANGFDCSGFIKLAYWEAFQQQVPRTTEKLIRHGEPIRRDQLTSGDVVFFQTSYKQLHAGIYLGDNTFMHASTSKGVIRSNLDNIYWKRKYLKARRFL